MANERRPLDRDPVAFFSGALGVGQTLFAAQGLATTPVYDFRGQKRLRGYVFTDQAPAAGFPRVRFGATSVALDIVVPLAQDSSQAANTFPFDLWIPANFGTIELTNGGVLANVRVAAWVYPEGDGASQFTIFPPGGAGTTDAVHVAATSAALAAGANTVTMRTVPAGFDSRLLSLAVAYNGTPAVGTSVQLMAGGVLVDLAVDGLVNGVFVPLPDGILCDAAEVWAIQVEGAVLNDTISWRAHFEETS
jgi:hypothetical protein